MSDWLMEIWIPGTPITQGSMRHVGKGRLVHGKGLIPWRDRITESVKQYTGTWFGAWEPLDEPVEVQAVFYLARPAAARNRPLPHIRGGDLDKYARALGDALAPKVKGGGCDPSAFLFDDSRIVDLRVSKRYAHGMPGEGEVPGVQVKVRRKDAKNQDDQT